MQPYSVSDVSRCTAWVETGQQQSRGDAPVGRGPTPRALVGPELFRDPPKQNLSLVAPCDTLLTPPEICRGSLEYPVTVGFDRKLLGTVNSTVNTLFAATVNNALTVTVFVNSLRSYEVPTLSDAI